MQNWLKSYAMVMALDCRFCRIDELGIKAVDQSNATLGAREVGVPA